MSLSMSLPAVMQHLQVLEASGLVRTEKVGRVRTCQFELGALKTGRSVDHRSAHDMGAPTGSARGFSGRAGLLSSLFTSTPEQIMSEKPVKRSATHATFVIDREYAASPPRVYAAWSSQEAKARWFVGPEEWERSDHRLDFRVGGREHVSGGPPGGRVHKYDAVYQDIVPNERIILTYDMHLDDNRISVSVATLEFGPAGTGTRLVYTEQGVFLDGYDDAGSREHGTRELLDKLDAELNKAGASR
jgi:uncharacterized protein YndB with AHSA1/START domain